MRQYSSRIPLLLLSLLFLHRWTSNSFSLADNITWFKPAAGNVYPSGGHFIAQWQSDIPTTTFTFQLCDDENVECGTSVQPPSERNGSESYQVILVAPEVVQVGSYVLRMSSDSPFTSTSPSFFISPPQGNNVSTSTSSSIREEDVGGTSETPSVSPRTMPNLTQSHTPASAAAYAVPLSLAGTIVLLASIICAVQRRKLLHERAECQTESQLFRSMFHNSQLHNTFNLPLSGHTSAKSLHENLDAEDEKEPEARRSDIYTRPYVPHLAKERRPRVATKSPRTTSASGRTTVPARYFKAALSPRVPFQTFHSSSPGRVDSPRTLGYDAVEGLNAAVNETVISNYMQPSPMPPTLAPIPMARAHVRQQASEGAGWQAADIAGLYGEVARRLT